MKFCIFFHYIRGRTASFVKLIVAILNFLPRLTPLIFVIISFFLLQSCANQLPPGGGEEDKTPPRITGSNPKQGTINFKGDRIEMRLSEYVDRRSFQDAFRISPPVPGDIEFDWSGKEVDVVFPERLWKMYPDKTFLVNLNTTLTDIHGNALTQPQTFAFSTGGTIDKAQISGTIFNNEKKILTILAYNISANENSYAPSTRLADYITEASAEGNYTLPNLAPGKYRIIAIRDDDRNLYYTADREGYALLSSDITVQDSMSVTNVDFYFNDITKLKKEIDTTDFFSDSLGIVFSSVENDAVNFPSDQSILLYFKNYTPVRSELESRFQLKDEQNNLLKLVFNWKNDSLLEVFPALNFQNGTRYSVEFPVTLLDTICAYKLTFRTALTNSYGDISGTVKLPEGVTTIPPILIRLETKVSKSQVTYEFSIQDTVFYLKKILENTYDLFAFIDENGNGVYDYGKPVPYVPAEKFFIYSKPIKVMGGWVIEKITLSF
jgi:hypothetical protein